MNKTFFWHWTNFFLLGVFCFTVPYILDFLTSGTDDELSPNIAKLGETVSTTGEILGGFILIICSMVLGFKLLYVPRQSTAPTRSNVAKVEQNEEYANSIYGILKSFNKYREEENEILNAFFKTADSILHTGKGQYLKDNILFFETEAYHELIALREVLTALNKNISIQEPAILSTLEQITKGLKTHYQSYCKINLEPLKDELVYLKALEKKDAITLDKTHQPM